MSEFDSAIITATRLIESVLHGDVITPDVAAAVKKQISDIELNKLSQKDREFFVHSLKMCNHIINPDIPEARPKKTSGPTLVIVEPGQKINKQGNRITGQLPQHKPSGQ